MSPLYFATQPLDGRQLHIKAGELFPVQTKGFIRGLARNYGVDDGDSCPFSSLPYVAVLDAQTEGAAQQIRQLRLTLDEASERLAAGKTPRKRAAA